MAVPRCSGQVCWRQRCWPNASSLPEVNETKPPRSSEQARKHHEPQRLIAHRTGASAAHRAWGPGAGTGIAELPRPGLGGQHGSRATQCREVCSGVPIRRLIGPDGPVPLLEVFEGRRQLVAWYFMHLRSERWTLIFITLIPFILVVDLLLGLLPDIGRVPF